MEEGGMSQATIVKFMATKTTSSITWANREKIHGSPGGGGGGKGFALYNVCSLSTYKSNENVLETY